MLNKLRKQELEEREKESEFDARVKASLDRMQANGFIVGDGDFAHYSVPASESNVDESNSRSYAKVSSDWVMTTKADSWAGSEASSSYPSKEEIRSVLHTLCAYAYDNLYSFRVVAEGIDGVGNGVLQFGIDSHPEDLKGSTFEQLVERLAAYSPNKDELPRDKQAAKAEFFSGGEAIGSSAGGRADVVIGGSSPASLTNEELPHTLPPHIMLMIKEASELEAKRDALQSYIDGNDENLPDDNRVSVRLRAEQLVAMSSYHKILKDRIANETFKHFGGEL